MCIYGKTYFPQCTYHKSSFLAYMVTAWFGCTVAFCWNRPFCPCFKTLPLIQRIMHSSTKIIAAMAKKILAVMALPPPASPHMGLGCTRHEGTLTFGFVGNMVLFDPPHHLFNSPRHFLICCAAMVKRGMPTIA